MIDLTGAEDDADARRAVASYIREACRDTGFFYIVGHGVAEPLVAAQLAETQRFFAQSEAAKRALDIARSNCWRGYEGTGAQVLDPGSPADHKESFALAVDLPADHPLVLAGVPHQGPNQWPDALPGFREQMLAYQAAMIALGTRLMRLLAMSVDLDADFFADGLAEPQCGVRLLRYPPQPAADASNRLGAGAHTDWGSITILLQDDLAGLEVRDGSGGWILASPLPGAFVINLGQMMERFTGGRYRASLHRVRNTAPDRARYSVATFFELHPLYRMGVAPSCATPGEPPLPMATIGEHLEAMARVSYGG